jgi:hypothetical protein
VKDCKIIATQLTNTAAGRGDIATSNSSPKTVRSPARRSRDGRETSGKKSGEISRAISAQRPGNTALKKLGFGKTAAYDALSEDGRFSAWLQYAPDGIITWTNHCH